MGIQKNLFLQINMATRELPCPYKIIDDFGGAFAMGCFSGCINYFFKGMWYSPKNERILGGVMLSKKRAPILGGNFALWGGLFSATECTMIHLRKKQDYLNSVVSGFTTGWILAIRSGWRVACRNAFVGSVIMGCIQMVEVGIMKQKKKMELEMSHKVQQEQFEQQMQLYRHCLLYTSDAADEEDSVDLGGRRIIKKER
eukprot:TRINITY_DN1382_c0_g1_i1.p2 TRINITY_DN1382_c0_g1~~TRINITY_DN1382_c0_g1_i1.p2  ORF type:complete len:199 (+),score=34.97 TRINITY_DN1382_c0_g1_i1:240-836(+)